jgi:hypothetical protein
MAVAIYRLVMLEYIYIPGLQYSNESREQAEDREKKMEDHNRIARAHNEEMERQRKLPMKSMREWAILRGISQHNA